MGVHSEVHLTGIAGMAVSSRFVKVNGQILATQTGTESHAECPRCPRDGNIDPVVKNIGRDCPT